MKISFDFDCTLGEDVIKKLADFLVKSGADIYIITSRNCGQHCNRDLYSVASKLKIQECNIHFTESSWKWRKVKELEIDIHFDDIPEECQLISSNTQCSAMLLWDSECIESIRHESFGKGIY